MPTRSDIQRCEGCVYFDPSPNGDDSGMCRRRAPDVLLTAETAPWAMTVWPTVKKIDWCGEFNPRKIAGARQPH